MSQVCSGGVRDTSELQLHAASNELQQENEELLSHLRAWTVTSDWLIGVSHSAKVTFLQSNFLHLSVVAENVLRDKMRCSFIPAPLGEDVLQSSCGDLSPWWTWWSCRLSLRSVAVSPYWAASITMFLLPCLVLCVSRDSSKVLFNHLNLLRIPQPVLSGLVLFVPWASVFMFQTPGLSSLIRLFILCNKWEFTAAAWEPRAPKGSSEPPLLLHGSLRSAGRCCRNLQLQRVVEASQHQGHSLQASAASSGQWDELIQMWRPVHTCLEKILWWCSSTGETTEEEEWDDANLCLTHVSTDNTAKEFLNL